MLAIRPAPATDRSGAMLTNRLAVVKAHLDNDNQLLALFPGRTPGENRGRPGPPQHPSRSAAAKNPAVYRPGFTLTSRKPEDYNNSKIPAAPMPPPMHMETMPRLTPRRRIS